MTTRVSRSPAESPAVMVSVALPMTVTRVDLERPGDAPPIGTRGRAPSVGAALMLLALVGGVAPIAYAWHFGALGIPRNDDWAYAPAAFQFAHSLKVTGGNWAAMNLVGQLVLSFPVVSLFGNRIAALQIEVAAIGVVGLLATFDLARQLLSPRRALFVAILVAALPMWASLSTSYMTDVPSYALVMTSLALGTRAVSRTTVRAGYFSGSLAVGLLAFTVRENGVVAPLAVSAATVWLAARRPRSRLSPIIAWIFGFVASAGLFYVWRRSLAGFVNAAPRAPSLSRLELAAHVSLQAGLLVGLLVSPAVVLANPWRLLRVAWARAPRVTVGAAAVTAGLFAAAILRPGHPRGVLGPGDYVLPNGSLGTEMLKGVRPNLFPTPILAALTIIGVSALTVIVCAGAAAVAKRVSAVLRRQPSTSPSPAFVIVALAAFGYSIGCLLAVALGYSRLFDRYLLPIVPLVAILALRTCPPSVTAPRRVRIAGCMTLAVLAAVGAIYGTNSASFDGAKWRVASDAVKLAGDPKLVDGGHVWNDYQAGRHVRGRFRGACIVLRAGPKPTTRDTSVVGLASVWGLNGTQVWIVARQQRPC